MRRRVRKHLAHLRRLYEAARHYDTSVLSQFRRFKRLHDRLLFSLDDALFWGLTDPALPLSETDSYLSREASTRLRARVNHSRAFSSVNDKALFYRLSREHGLPIPETFGILRRQAGTPHRSADPELPQVDLLDLPDGSIVAKPVWGMKGVGVQFFEKRGSSFSLDDQELSANELRSILHANVLDDDYVLQRRLLPHSRLAEISGGGAVQSARIVTYVDRAGKAHVLFARFKFVRKTSVIDNFADGTTGNLVADVDLDSGRVTRVVSKTPGRIGVEAVTHHPDTGQGLFITLPGWHEAIRVVTEAARLFEGLGSLGWDVALTPDGPRIIEANQEWEIFPIGPYRKPLPLGDWEFLIR